MSNSANKIKVSASACLKEKEIMEYLRNLLPSDERNRIEKHLLECDLCSDAMEVINTIKKDEQALEGIDEWIDEKVKHASFKKNRRIIPIRFNYLVAAAIALLIIIGGVLYFTLFKSADNEKIYTQNFKPFPNNNKITNEKQSDQKEMTSKSNVDTGASNINDTNIVYKRNHEKVITKKTLKINDLINKYKDGLDEHEGSNNKKDEDIRIEMDNENTPQSIAGNYGDRFHEIASSSFKSADTLLNSAMNSYEQKQYDDAIKKFNDYRTIHPYNKKANFYSAISNLSLNNTTLALSQLNLVLNTGQSEYSDAARWYKTLALIKLNKTKDAKILLQEIIKSDSKYADEAGKLLDKL